MDNSLKHPLRVLFVNRMAGLERGGGETFDLEISRHLAKAGAQVTFLCGAPLLRPAPLPVPGARTLRTPWLRWFPWDKVKGGWRVRQLEFEIFEWRAARWIARHAAEFDVIQVCELPNLVHWLKKRGVKTPVVMRLTAPNYYDPRGGVRQADALIASGTSIQKLRELGLEVEDIPNAVDADRFRPQPSDFRETHGIGRDEFVALYVARFQAFKNHAMLLKAFALFTREHPAARLALAGSGPLRERCEQQAKALGIAGQVLFLGEVPFDDYMYSIEKSAWWSQAPEMQDKPEEYRKEKQVERLVTLAVSQHPDIESVVIRDNWAWARKKPDAAVPAGPTVTPLTKTVARRWLLDLAFRRKR